MNHTSGNICHVCGYVQHQGLTQVHSKSCQFYTKNETTEALNRSTYLVNTITPADVELMRKVNGGIKHDNGKPDLSLLPRVALELEAKVMEFGAKKYGRYNYKAGFEYTRLLAAALRHINAFNDGEDNDQESNISHLSHARCCLGMLLDCIALGTATDNRYKKENL